MEKRKFKVGERYKSRMILDNAAVIEITEINGDFVSYKDVERETSGRKMFEIGSIFSDNLEKVGSETIVIYRNDNKVVALDKSTGKKAEAKCNPVDEFDFRTGAKLAFSRLMGEDAKLDDGVREVKRKAKVGEYIKIVDAQPYLIPYKNGDIFKVISTSKPGVVIEKDGTPVTSAWHREYVVLENYKPEKEPEKEDEIRVGDTVKVTDGDRQYCLYDKWSGLDGYKQNFVIGSYLNNEDEYKVLRIKKHDINNGIIALIQNPKTAQVFIIGIEGLKKVER
jgi:hypothetical protein|nr:MAG TPA: hypothetical protein [Caudoviricetes sp.]